MDLLTAINMNIYHFKEQTGLSVELDVTGAAAHEDIKPEVRINILNIVKEALNNIAKHAKAESVRVVLEFSNKKIFVLIEVREGI